MRVPDVSLGIGRERVVVVGDHERVAALFVFEEKEQALFVHEPHGKGEIAFLILRGQAAPRIETAVADIETPCRRQLALAIVGLEDRVEDVEHGLVLEHAAVAAQGQERGPWLDGEKVAGKPAVGSHLLDGGRVAMEAARLSGWVAGLELDEDRLADQRPQRDSGIERQCRDVETEAGVDALVAAQALGQ